MRANVPGALENSVLYFHVASPRAKNLFFYPVCTGHYYCSEEYEVNRTNYDNFLLLYVLRGSGFVEIDGHKAALGQGSIAYINCYKPHRYYTTKGWEILWLHFDGPLAKEYYSEITRDYSFVFHSDNEMAIMKNMNQIYDYFDGGKKQIDEVRISNMINNILTALFLNTSTPTKSSGRQNPLKDTLFFISQHLDETLPIDFLATRIFLSKYHFIRLFKKEVGYTPHEYILMSRINAAMLALKTSSSSIKDIALDYGFTSESSFCTTFKRFVGMTPLTYRLSHDATEDISLQ